MGKQQLVNQFTKSIIVEGQQKNKVGTNQITSTLITAALSSAFVNESCKSSGQVSKSQVIYRKLDGKLIEEMRECLLICSVFKKHDKNPTKNNTPKSLFY
jgi:hypothetical protein